MKLSDELERLAKDATPGPYDTMPGSLVRAIRGDVAIPILEARAPWGEIIKAPTVRGAEGKVLFRAGSRGAEASMVIHAEHRNIELAATLLNNLPTIIAAIKAMEDATP